ncbi:hypothetical protein [Lactococcus lactis]|uniref:Uncharacterized protein n=1 Tax=Lactococcus lactis TaxID=1358 RepID=A0AAP8JDK1_9LACT|nr:hypothetical protein [Lactococcus lactis]MDG4971393.1 hypothetical protein [Lactococcus lactis]PFG88830.1 hypothetical protein BW154_04875 [Lactococcus lactis]
MHLYHSTPNKEDIIKNKKINVNKKFNYTKYLEYILVNSHWMKTPDQLPGNYTKFGGSAPFMGHGIYCFDNEKDALDYQANSEVVDIHYQNDCSKMDLDDEMVLLSISNYLDELEYKFKEECTDKEVLPGWLHLIALLKLCLYDEFKTSEPAVGLILFILCFYKKINRSDLLIRSFYVKIGLVDEEVNKKRYILISNKDKIEKMC